MRKIQVDKSNYFTRKYFTEERFLSYYNQILATMNCNPDRILEVGVGDKTVSNYLRNAEYNIVTCDFDKGLKPDVVADIINLPFSDGEFDTIIAFEILEHLPFKDFITSLKELERVSSNNVIISIPCTCAYFEIFFKTKINFHFRKFFKMFYFSFKFPYFFKEIKIEDNGQHYWELGSKGYSKKRVREVIEKIFVIDSEFHPRLNPYHYYFILKKK